MADHTDWLRNVVRGSVFLYYKIPALLGGAAYSGSWQDGESSEELSPVNLPPRAENI